jgi:hypothetical protein
MSDLKTNSIPDSKKNLLWPLRNKFAGTAHEVWAHWMQYQFSVCEVQADGSLLIPKSKVKRWTRQMETAYSDLTEKEQKSDLSQADKYLLHISPTVEVSATKTRPTHMETVVRLDMGKK